jgi:protein SCO1/2
MDFLLSSSIPHRNGNWIKMGNHLVKQLTVGIFLGAFLIFAGYKFANQPYTYQGSIIDPAKMAPDFELQTGGAREFQLSDFKGQIVLLYFGYTFCPDVCPTTMYDLVQVKNALGDEGQNLTVAMITVDPKRDTPEVLNTYVKTFDQAFYGLSGDFASLEDVWAKYGVFRSENAVEGSSGYLVDHTARVFVIDTEGKLRLTFPFGMPSEAISEDLQHLLNE